MIKVNYLSKYFLDGVEPFPDAIAPVLKEDLEARVETIYQDVLKAEIAPSDLLLQPAKNSLRHSVGQISLKDQPFFKNSGQCSGSCTWFIALYLHLKNKHPEISTHQLLLRIAKEFEEGAGVQAAFLQRYQKNNDKIIEALKLSREKTSEIDFNLRFITHKKGVHEDTDLYTEILQKISELKNGIYKLSFPGSPAACSLGRGDEIPGHATVIIVENESYYFFDPNVGLIGTGDKIGSQNKMNDAMTFMAICRQYLPYGQADELFHKGIESLLTTLELNPEQVGIIQTVAKCRGRGNVFFGAYAAFAIAKELSKNGRNLTKEEEDKVLIALSVAPALLMVRLESDGAAIRFNKFSVLE